MISKHTFDEAVRIYNLGDIHRDSPQCDAKFLHLVIAEIAGNSNARWVSTGDLLDVATRHSVSDVHDAISVQQEADMLALELAPIKDKCLGFVTA